MTKLRNVWELSEDEAAAVAAASEPETRAADQLMAGVYAEMCFLSDASEEDLRRYLPVDEFQQVLAYRAADSGTSR